MVELSGLFLRHGLAVTIVVVEPPAASTDASTAVARAAEANPSVNFHVLPLPPPDTTVPPAAAEQGQGQEPPRDPFALLRRANAPLRDYLRSVLASASVRALVLDMFCVDALDVAAELGVPAYIFYTSSASSLAVSLHMPHKQAEVNASFGDIGDAPLFFPGVPPFRPTELPENALDRDNQVYRKFLRAFERVPNSRGILVNTFERLEARAVAALRDGACVPGRSTPPVYCFGPLVSGGGEVKNTKHECLAWLERSRRTASCSSASGAWARSPRSSSRRSPPGSRCPGTGSCGVRSPRRDGRSLFAYGSDRQLPEPDLGELLPEGFLERTKAGLVAKSWAPQADVLRHRATGAFVTHCGWNSVLEGITAGVPLLCWPLYAEQRLNKVFMVEEARVGMEMAGYDREVVTAQEVEAKVRWVMDSEDGRALRPRAMVAKEKALEALQQGGTSHNALL